MDESAAYSDLAGYTVFAPLTLSKLLQPPDKQRRNSSSCYEIAAWIVAHQYQKIFPDVFKKGHFDCKARRTQRGLPVEGPAEPGKVTDVLDDLFGTGRYDLHRLSAFAIHALQNLVHSRPVVLPHVFSTCFPALPEEDVCNGVTVTTRDEYIYCAKRMSGWETNKNKAARLHSMAVVGYARHCTGEEYWVCRHSWEDYCPLALLPCVSKEELEAAGVPWDVVKLHVVVVPSTVGGGPALTELPVVADTAGVVPSCAEPEVFPTGL